MVETLKVITKEEINALIKNHILMVAGNGLVDKNGYSVCYTSTRHKKFIMDSYADLAQQIMRGGYSCGKEKT